MATKMPPCKEFFRKRINAAVELALRVEQSALSGKGITLGSQSVEHLFELAYLQIFSSWEAFLEDSLVGYVAGRESPSGFREVKVVTLTPDLVSARGAVLGGSNYVSWANTSVALARFASIAPGGVHESVMLSDQTTLDALAKVRHAVAHASEYSKEESKRHAISVLNVPPRFASRPGLFLRNTRVVDDEPVRWIEWLADRLSGLAEQIVP